MSALAGVVVGAFCKTSSLVLTEGNPQCVQNIQAIIDENKDTFISKNVSSRQILWDLKNNYQEEFDVILIADCLYEESLHSSLLHVLFQTLKTAGKAFILAPKRGTRYFAFIKKKPKSNQNQPKATTAKQNNYKTKQNKTKQNNTTPKKSNNNKQ